VYVELLDGFDHLGKLRAALVDNLFGKWVLLTPKKSECTDSLCIYSTGTTQCLGLLLYVIASDEAVLVACTQVPARSKRGTNVATPARETYILCIVLYVHAD
jgi:hypothetical protein